MANESIFKNLATVTENPNMLTFQLSPTHVSYANTLRRTILIGVESVAFRSDMNEKGETSDVTVLENTTPMTNEMLADRIGLIPIHADPDTWNPDDYKFELQIQNETSDTLPVTAGDFVVRKRGDDANPLVPNKDFFHPNPVSGDTALIALLKGKQPSQAGQKIHLIAKASVGTGRDHIRFSPVCQCSYGYTVDPDETRQREQFEKWLSASKKKDPKELKENKALEEVLMREFQTMEVQRCFMIDPRTGEPNSFDFVIETVGVQSVERIVERALKNIETKLAKYSNLDKQAPETVTILPADARMKGYDFIFRYEDHTLGNLLQTYMEQTMMGSDVSFVGYKVPHPLRDEMVLRVGVNFPLDPEKDGKENTARVAVAKAAKECSGMFAKWREDWMRAINRGKGSRNLKSLRLTAENARAVAQAASLAEQVSTKQPSSKQPTAKVAVK